MKNTPLASIIIRTKDRKEFLERAIESAYSQTYPNVEIVVVNDGGHDVMPLIKHFRSLPQPKGVSRKIQYIANAVAQGRPSAANIGFKAAAGDYLGLLDDDDYHFHHHVAEHIAALEESGKKVSFSQVTESFEDTSIAKDGSLDSIQQGRRVIFPSSYNKLALLYFDNYHPINAFMLHKSVFDKIGYFDATKKVLEDWDFIIRLTLNFEPVYVDAISSEFTTRNDGSNVRQDPNAKKMWQDSFIAIRKKYAEALETSDYKVPVSEVANLLTQVSIERYHLTHENDRLRNSVIYKLYNSKYFAAAKRIAKVFGLTRG